jgi:mandelate racemase
MSSALKIRAIRTRPVAAPLRTPLTTASGALTEAPLLLIDLETDQGIAGRAYLVAYQRFLLKPLDTLVRSIADGLVGEPLVPADLEKKMRARFTLMGGTRGLAGIAISGLDMAVWDALACSRDMPLAVLLGGSCKPIRAYNSLGMIAAAQAPEEAAKALENGFKAVKIKIGWPTIAEDLAAIRAFRKAIPGDVALMADFNQSLSVAEAIRRGQALDDEGLTWLEEPVRCDDFAGCAKVAASLKTPVQIGENFSGPFDMEAALATHACDYVMPDPQQIGGVSGWLRAAALAQAAGKDCSSHIFIEISAHLLPMTPTCHYLEWLDLASGVIAEPLKVVNGAVAAPERPGIGISWDEAAVKRYALT